MPVPLRLHRVFCLLLFLATLGFLAWTALRRADRVHRVTMTDAAAAKVDAQSLTGYARERRWLIVPEHHTPSYEQVAQTQQMLATGTWRVRRVDYDNAPQGRPVYSASLYRWWLASLAWIERAISGRPIGLSVERAAVWSEPLLHLGLLLIGSAAVRRWFGGAAAVWFALGVAFLFPLAASFLPGVPDDASMARMFALASVLPLLAALRRPRGEEPAANHRRARRLFAFAGIAGGFGLWIAAPQQTWILAGTCAGAILALIVAAPGRAAVPENQAAPLPWRVWAAAGALTSTTAYLLEYAPANFGLRLEVNHPLYAIAWVGVGEFLMLLESFAKQRSGFWRFPRVLALLAALAAAAALPVALGLLQPQHWFSGDFFASRLTNLPDGTVAPSLSAWLRRDGLSLTLAATLAPLLLLIPALALIFSSRTEPSCRRQLALALGPVAGGLSFALMQLEWWATLDALLLGVLVVLVTNAAPAEENRKARWRPLSTAFAALAVALGIPKLLPPPVSGEKFALTPLETEALIERAAAHWIADRAGPDGTVILAPPARSIRWCFHASPLRGLGSAAWENREGLAATIRIATAQTGEEAQALLQERGVSYLVLPSSDEDLRQFARLALKDPEDAFIMAVHQWAIPSWLRPLPFPPPSLAGVEGESLVLLQVTEEANRAPALARMVEYFLETNQPALADAAGEALGRFPADANALIGRAQLQKALGETEAFATTFEALRAGLAGGFDRGLPWDRRVSLAIVLAQGERHDLAREQVQRCLERLDADRILTLTTGALYRLLVLAQAYDLAIADPDLRERALALLPEPLRARLARRA